MLQELAPFDAKSAHHQRELPRKNNVDAAGFPALTPPSTVTAPFAAATAAVVAVATTATTLTATAAPVTAVDTEADIRPPTGPQPATRVAIFASGVGSRTVRP